MQMTLHAYRTPRKVLKVGDLMLITLQCQTCSFKVEAVGFTPLQKLLNRL